MPSRLTSILHMRADTISALSGVRGKYDGQIAVIDGHTTRGDGGGGDFVWFSDSTDTSDGGTVLGTGTGRWKRKYSGPVDVRWFGAKGDGITDDSSAIQAALDASDSGIFFTDGSYVCGGVEVQGGTTIDLGSAIILGKINSSHDGTPIFDCVGTGEVVFRNGTVNGRKSSQTSETFADAYLASIGGVEYGRAFRAAIKADASVETGLTSVRVIGVTFTGVFGACVATRLVPDVVVDGCSATDCNFELAFLYTQAGSPANSTAIVTGNRLKNIGTGDATVNSDGFIISHYDRVVFSGNTGENLERCLLKSENSIDIHVSDSSLNGNTVDNYPGFQFYLGNAVTCRSLVAKGLSVYDTGMGLSFSGEGSVDNAVISGFTAKETTGTTGDGLQLILSGSINSLTVSDVSMYSVARHGIYVDGKVTDSLTVRDCYMQGNQSIGGAFNAGLMFNASVGSWGKVLLSNVHVKDFDESGVSEGMVCLFRSSSYVFSDLVLEDCYIDTGSASNRGFRINADIVTAGEIRGNRIIGQLEHYSSGLRMGSGNRITGAIVVPDQSFTPTVTFGGGSTGITYTTRVGQWTVSGRRVFFDLNVVLSSKGSSTGSMSISGLPIACKTLSGYKAVCAAGGSSVTYSGTLAAEVLSGTSAVVPFQFSEAGGAKNTLSDTSMTNTSSIFISGSYEVAGLDV